MGTKEESNQEIIFVEQLSSKLCHDIAGITGAINNNADFLDDTDQTFRERASFLLKQNTRELVSRVKFFRLLYGNIDKNAENSLFEALNLTKNHLAYTKIILIYDENSLKNFSIKTKSYKVKIIVNLLFLCSACIIGSGQIYIKLNENSDEILFELKADHIKKQDNLNIILDKMTEIKIDPKNVQAFYSLKLLQEYNYICKLTKIEDKEMIFSLKEN